MANKATVVKINSLSREKWVKRISTAWSAQLQSIFETGVLLEACKSELDHGEWSLAFKNKEMPFSQNTAGCLMKIANNENLRNSEHVQNLPAHWGTLYQLTKLTDEQFAEGIKSGIINPSMQRSAVAALLKIPKKERKQQKYRQPATLEDFTEEMVIQIHAASLRLTPEERKELYHVIIRRAEALNE